LDLKQEPRSQSEAHRARSIKQSKCSRQRGRGGWPICSVRVDLRRMGNGLEGLPFESRWRQRLSFPTNFPERFWGYRSLLFHGRRGSLLG